ncbi:MAG TPA: alpha/beta fold hydrolase, partial [Chloroflexota bacterium]|nr:alpha/beta fold hydrolase [Chloroflexota bacterium]
AGIHLLLRLNVEAALDGGVVTGVRWYRYEYVGGMLRYRAEGTADSVQEFMRVRNTLMLLTICVTWMLGACIQTPVRPPARGMVTWAEIAALPMPPADYRSEYGTDPLQFGDLRLPRGAGPHPVAVIIHGGCWRSEYDLQHISHLSAALTRAGIATWTLEYRRVGDSGGGWTGTFEDVIQGTEYLRTLAQRFPLDLDRMVLVGHSAGGHLALWLAARRNLPQESPLYSPAPLPVQGVVSLAGITDLRTYGSGSGSCNAAVAQLLGGTAEEVPDRYAQASPIELLPLSLPQRLVHGALDPIVPLEQSQRFAARAQSHGDDAQLWLIEGAGHFDLIAPFAPAWARVEQAVHSVISAR